MVSTNDRLFLDAVKRIFLAPEVLVVIRYVYAAGNRDFLILKNMDEFHNLLAGLRLDTQWW
jgi:hypothetical protein